MAIHHFDFHKKNQARSWGMGSCIVFSLVYIYSIILKSSSQDPKLYHYLMGTPFTTPLYVMDDHMTPIDILNFIIHPKRDLSNSLIWLFQYLHQVFRIHTFLIIIMNKNTPFFALSVIHIPLSSSNHGHSNVIY